MPDTSPMLLSDWDALDAFKAVDEEAYVAGLLKNSPMTDTLRAAAVRRRTWRRVMVVMSEFLLR